MRIKHTLFLFALLLVSIHLSSIIAYAQRQSSSSSTIHDGYVYSYQVSDKDLVNTPSWNPETGDPPINLRQAVEIARQYLGRFVMKTGGLDIADIELTQMGIEKWLYEIRFHCWKDECEDEDVMLFPIYVKMDGSVIDPEIRPDTEKEKDEGDDNR